MKASSFASGGLFVLAFTTGMPVDSIASDSLRTTSGENTVADQASHRIALEEIVVTGSRLRLPQSEGAAPVIVFDEAAIDESGVSSIPDLLRFLPQQSYNFIEGRNFGAAQFAEMRGLGVDTTLVLLNGRRVVPSAPSVSANAFDLNTIPLAAVERVEVLSDSASAVYGADAMGGVINIILKKEIPRPVLNLRYGAARGGAEERRVSLSSGYSGDRLRASVVADYFDRTFLLGEKRDRWRNQDFTRFGGVDRRSANTNPGNISSRTAANLPGLPSRVAAVPEGSTGVGLTPSDFAATAGQRRTDSLRRFWSIVPEAERFSLAAFGEFDLTSSITAFAEALYVERSTTSQFEPSTLSSARVPAGNPFNPFGVDVSASYLFTGIGSERGVVEAESVRGVAGLRGPMASWEWELSLLGSDEDGESWTENAVSSVLAGAALSATDPMQALNVFQDGPGGNAALLASLIAPPAVSRYASTGKQAAGFVRGDAFVLPAGAVSMVVGAEWREEEVLQSTPRLRVDDDRTVSAIFAEMRLPLVSAAMQVPAIEQLAINVALRRDEYSDFGESVNPQYGLLWHVTPDLLLRASYGTGFRAPSLFELFAPRTTNTGSQVVDPRRNDEVVSATTFSGGNPELEPIEAQSLSTGFVFTPSALNGLRLAVSYWKIQMDERVASFFPELVLANEGTFPERVVREAPTPADEAAGLPGVIRSIDSSRINFGMLDTGGVDIDVSYRITSPVGEFTPRLMSTWIDSYEEVQVPSTPAVQRVGIGNLSGTIPEWRGVASLSWSLRSLSASLTARYVDGYAEATLDDRPTGKRVPSQTLIDVQAVIDLDAASRSESLWLRGFKLTAGVANVLDDEPNFTATSSSGYDLSQGDLRQQFGYLQVEKSF